MLKQPQAFQLLNAIPKGVWHEFSRPKPIKYTERNQIKGNQQSHVTEIFK